LHQHKGLIVYSWCIMSNHIHLIIQTANGKRMSDIIRDFKKFTAKAIIKLITEGKKSRKNWILNRMEYRGKYLKRIEKYKFWEEGNHAIELISNWPGIFDQTKLYTSKPC
jgi:putative transposase